MHIIKILKKHFSPAERGVLVRSRRRYNVVFISTSLVKLVYPRMRA